MKFKIKLIPLLLALMSASCFAGTINKLDNVPHKIPPLRAVQHEDDGDSDADIEAYIKEVTAKYKTKTNALSKKRVPTLALSPELYASLYFHDSFKQPLVGLPALRRMTIASAEVEFSVDVAENSFGPGGSRENLASRVFGKKDIQLQDLALVVRLSNNNPAVLQQVGALNNFADFQNLAEEPVKFEALSHREQLQLGASVGLFENHLRLSFGVPVAMGTNQLRVANDGALFNKVFARNAFPLAGNFKDQTLAQFIDTLVDAMKMKTGERITSYGLGQSFIGATCQLPVTGLDQAQLGVQFYMPTATKPDPSRVWPVELGTNNMAVAGNIVLLAEQSRFFNPYLHADGRFNFQSKAARRVPRLVSKGFSVNPMDKMALGNWVDYTVAGFEKEKEASVRGFSDFSSDVNWTLGHSMTFQIGNIFERVIDRGGYLDLAYRFGLKFKDQVFSVQQDGDYYTDPLVANTDEQSHQIRLGYGYHFTNNFRLSVLGSLVFAGKNVPQAWNATALLGFSF